MKFRTIINFNVSRTTFFFVFSFCSPIEYLLCVHSLSLSLTKQGKTRGVFSGHIHRPHSKRETWNIPSNIIGLLFIRCGYWCVVSTGRILAWTMHRATGLLSFLTQKFKLTKMSSLLPLEYWFFFVFLLAATQTHRQNEWTWNTRRDDATGISVEVDDCENRNVNQRKWT